MTTPANTEYDNFIQGLARMFGKIDDDDKWEFEKEENDED